ncbi:LamG domain-containing protein [Methylomicrobium album]|uniref:Fibronectin type III domain-containing protein n=1 Tax=Methylomicrobium album BG8 TaxID=686340 RepID=H8GIL5_METAL|nr:LamG-like jellyroll fold domain-containing protein [Methylomicrobium album]EIC29042.1 fibronectin type III domain-containing protein [Methylomicrobium album BG8]
MRHFLRILAPLSFSGNLFAATVNLAWDPSESPAVEGYKVAYGTGSGNYTSTVDAGNKTSLSVSGLNAGTRYFFAVKAYDSAGTTESAYSNELTLATPAPQALPAGPDPGDAPAPDAKSDGETSGGTQGGASGGATAGPLADAEGDGLMAAFGFEEDSGKTVVDASGNGNHGTIKGAVRTDDGRHGKALMFDGVNDWVTVKHDASLDMSNGLTLEAWVYPLSQSKGNNAVILKQAPRGEAYALYAEEEDDLPASYLNDGDYHRVAGANRLPADTWSHLVATYDGANQRLYVNGVEVAQSPQTAMIRQSKGKLRIGGNSLGNEYFHGYIDEVRIYNRALTPDEVVANRDTAVDTSNPPQFVMGDNTLQPWVDYRSQGTAKAFRTVPAESGILTQIWVYLDAGSTATRLSAAIYKDRSRHPGTRMAQGKLSHLTAGAWNAIPVSAVSVTAGRPYWIALLGTEGQVAFRDQTGASTGLMETSASNKELKKLPYKWKGSATEQNASMSVYGKGY